MGVVGGRLDGTVGSAQSTGEVVAAPPGAESAPPEKPTRLRRGDLHIERIDRIGLELGTENKSQFHVEGDDRLSAVNELRRTWTMSRDDWHIRIETRILLTCPRNTFLL